MEFMILLPNFWCHSRVTFEEGDKFLFLLNKTDTLTSVGEYDAVSLWARAYGI